VESTSTTIRPRLPAFSWLALLIYFFKVLFRLPQNDDNDDDKDDDDDNDDFNSLS